MRSPRAADCSVCPPRSTLDAAGAALEGAAEPHPLPQETAVRMYAAMLQLQAADTIFYEAQRQVCVASAACGLRLVAAFSAPCLPPAAALKTAAQRAWPFCCCLPLQGRISFYMTSAGEEGTAIGSAAALSPDDVVFRWG